MDQNQNYYQHSGTIGPLAIPAMLASIAIGAPILGVVYGYLIYYIPIIYLNFIITLFFGASLGFLVGTAARIGKCRNTMAACLMGLLGGALGVYVAWVAWLHALTEGQFLLTPGEIATIMELMGITGVWSIFGWSPQGGALYAIWAVEALMILAISLGISTQRIDSLPFCEDCRVWASTRRELGTLCDVPDHDVLRTDLENGNFRAVAELGSAGEGENGIRFDVLGCPACAQQYFLSLVRLHHKEEKGKTSVEETPLLRHLLLSPAGNQALEKAVSHAPT